MPRSRTAADQLVEIGMQRRLAAAEGERAQAEHGEPVDARAAFRPVGTGGEKSSYSLQ